MGYAILRAEKRAKGPAGKMIGHALREHPVANAVDGGHPPEVLAGASSAAEARQALAGLVATAKAGGQRWRKDQVELVDLLVATSRIDMQQMGLARQRGYFSDALAWIRARWPHAKVVTAAVHRDESTPHMQVLLAPTDAQGRFSAKEMLGGPADMSRLQDAFHEAVGAKYGLSRGERHSGAKHVPVRQFYAALAENVEPPKFVDVPAVPAEPTVTDRITGKAGQIEEARRQALKARQAALEHNKQERERLYAQAKRGRAVHPAMMERQADRYRAAIRAEDAAKKALEEAQKQRQSAKNELEQAKVALDQAKASEASVQRQLDQIVLGDAKALDQFSRHWNPAYVGSLAKAAGVELVAGRGILDQLRRQGVATDVVDAARKVHEWDSRALQEAHRWRDQQQEIHRPKPP